LAELPIREQYTAVELFRGTMVRHNVIAYRSDRQDKYQLIQFDDDGWLGYVPIRRPRTHRITDRVRPGASAVLINQSHSNPDIVLPIDSMGVQLFDAIDGKLSIAEIANNVPTSKKQARSFFERLWQFDQVVYDASNPI